MFIILSLRTDKAIVSAITKYDKVLQTYILLELVSSQINCNLRNKMC